jgi:hypothetical protein
MDVVALFIKRGESLFRERGGCLAHYQHYNTSIEHTLKMAKRKEIAEGKRQAEEEHSNAGENITPLARRAAARSVAVRTATLNARANGLAVPERKLMASASSDVVADPREKKLVVVARDCNAVEDEDILVVDFAEARKEMKTPWIIIWYYNTKRVFNTDGLFTRLRQIWQLHGGMEENGMGEKRFLIVLDKEGDYNHILNGGPWLYQNYAFLVAKYDGMSPVREMKINLMPIWVRILEDGSLYAELRGDAAQTASTFLRKKKQPVSEDTTTEDGSESFVLRFRGDNENRSRGADASSYEVHQMQ